MLRKKIYIVCNVIIILVLSIIVSVVIGELYESTLTPQEKLTLEQKRQAQIKLKEMQRLEQEKAKAERIKKDEIAVEKAIKNTIRVANISCEYKTEIEEKSTRAILIFKNPIDDRIAYIIAVGLAKEILEALVANGHFPHEEKYKLNVTIQCMFKNKTGKDVYNILGEAHFDTSTDSIDYERY